MLTTLPSVPAIKQTAAPIGSATGGTAADVQDCSARRLQSLVEHFFAAYNQADLAGLNAVLDYTRDQFQYYDNVAGRAVDLRDRSSVEQYFQRRFTLKDQFAVTNVQIPADGNAGSANPTVAFTRTSTEGTYRGNAKLVCSLGKIIIIVTSSTAPH